MSVKAGTVIASAAKQSRALDAKLFLDCFGALWAPRNDERLPDVVNLRISTLEHFWHANLEQACGVAAHDRGLVGASERACARDEADRVLHSHVVGIIRAENQVAAAVLAREIV